MARSTSTHISILLILLMIICSNADILQASSHKGHARVQNGGIDSRRILREIELEFSKVKQNGRRLIMAGPDRVAPQGPDPQHH